jgi:predicted SAM-dependent methyltransferase
MNINLGSGPTHIDGWIEYDSSINIWLSRIPYLKKFLLKLGVLRISHELEWHPDVKKANIINLKFPENSVSNFYLSHVLEHVYRQESQKILINIFQGLSPGGIVRICSPDYSAFILNYIKAKDANELSAANAFEDSLLSYPASRPRGFDKIRRKFGGHIHYWHPFKCQIIEQLTVAGFTEITQHEFRNGNLLDINSVEQRSDNSFYLEARK